MSDNQPCYLLFGASSAIAQAVCKQLLSNGENRVICFSRSRLAKTAATNIILNDYQPDTLKDALSVLKLADQNIKGVYIFNGILHQANFRPEKALSQLTANTFSEVMTINALTPVIIIQAVLNQCSKQQSFKIAVLSARIGSIGDNRLGGWHSYRASKAALNMLIKNIAIEYERSHKGLKFISYHPGTTNSPLSRPFQSNVPKEQLFSAEQSARYFLSVVDEQPFDNQLSYVDWQGETIPW